MIPVQCPGCRTVYNFGPEWFGRMMRCQCGGVCQVPAAFNYSEQPPPVQTPSTEPALNFEPDHNDEPEQPPLVTGYSTRARGITRARGGDQPSIMPDLCVVASICLSVGSLLLILVAAGPAIVGAIGAVVLAMLGWSGTGAKAIAAVSIFLAGLVLVFVLVIFLGVAVGTGQMIAR